MFLTWTVKLSQLQQGINSLGFAPQQFYQWKEQKHVIIDSLRSNAPQASHLKRVQDLVIYMVKCKIFKSVSFNLKCSFRPIPLYRYRYMFSI